MGRKATTAALVVTRVLVVDSVYVYGPFQEAEIARDWADQHCMKGDWKLLRIWEREWGSAENAPICGDVLPRGG